MKLLLVICSIIVVNAQQPMPCESPKQWEASIHRVERGSPGMTPMSQRATLSYDELNERIKEVDEYSFSPTPEDMYERILLFKSNKEYKINLKTRQCNVTALTRTFRPFGVPKNATFQGLATIGASGIRGQFMNIQTWSFMDGMEKFYGTVTYPDCFPVDYAQLRPPSTFVTQSYYNIKLGIRDPTIFTPPSECMS